MASFISTNEVLEIGRAGAISRNGAVVTTRLLNQAAGVAEGLALVPSGTTGQECISPSTAALVLKTIGFSAFRPMSEDLDSTHHYSDNEAVSIMREGHMHVVVIDTTANAVEGVYSITLDNGVTQETFPYTTDGSATTAEILAGLVAAIDASANYSAAGTTEITVTLVAGTEIKIVELRAPTAATQLLWVVTDNQKCTRLPGCYFDASRTGAGLVEIRYTPVN
jgi:hypothetical protein